MIVIQGLVLGGRTKHPDGGDLMFGLEGELEKHRKSLSITKKQYNRSPGQSAMLFLHICHASTNLDGISWKDPRWRVLEDVLGHAPLVSYVRTLPPLESPPSVSNAFHDVGET